MTIAHWDELESRRPPRPAVGGAWSRLGSAAGSQGVGVNRIQLDAGEISTPAHVHGGDEEIFFVLGGSGLSWQDGATHEVRAGDCLAHLARGEAHTLRAGDGGLDVLAFGERTPLGGGYLPRAGIYWLYPTWAEVGQGEHPFEREQQLEWPEPTPRPSSIVNLDDVEGAYGGIAKHLGRAAGAKRTGLNWISLPPHEEGAPPHCHSAEEELFVVLEGEGTLELWGPPRPGQGPATEPQETHAVRRGHVVSRPPGTRVSHCFRTGDSPLTFLAYGTREPNDICFYPRSNKVFFRGVGLIARLEALEYSDGEPT
ncbi:MAG: hypothetical protein V7644_1550 [Actinomycetota bacterium]